MSDDNVNGTAPQAAEVEAEPAVVSTGGERALAIVAGLFGILVVLMAVDMLTGGRLTGYVQERSSDEQS
jgi:hypothetical protein